MTPLRDPKLQILILKVDVLRLREIHKKGDMVSGLNISIRSQFLQNNQLFAA